MNTKIAVAKGKRVIGALHYSVGQLAGSVIFERLVKAKPLPVFLYGVAVASPTSKQAWAQLEHLNHFAADLVRNDFR